MHSININETNEILKKLLITAVISSYNVAGESVKYKLFSECAPVGQHFSNFDAEAHATFLAVIKFFKSTVIFGDSTSAIETIVLQYYSESLSRIKIKHIIRELNQNNKQVEFQWIQSLIDIDGNERADQLTKRDTEISIEQDPLPFGILRENIRENIMLTYSIYYQLNQRINSVSK